MTPHDFDLTEMEGDDAESGYRRHQIGYPSTVDAPLVWFNRDGYLRNFARTLKRAARSKGCDLAHGSSLEATARVFGHSNWQQLLYSIHERAGLDIAPTDKLDDATVDACFLERFVAAIAVDTDTGRALYEEVRLRLLLAISHYLVDPEGIIARAKQKAGVSPAKMSPSPRNSISNAAGHATERMPEMAERPSPVVVIKKTRSFERPPTKRVFNLG